MTVFPSDRNAPGRVPFAEPEKENVPGYLHDTYWWAYEHPLAVKFWDRGFLIDFILLGHYGKLVDAVLDEFREPIAGDMLQISCAYGRLTPSVQKKLAPDAHLDVIDILPVQLTNTERKLSLPDDRIRLFTADATALSCPDDSYDTVLMFFLPHELPDDKRRAAFAEAYRVTKPGGRMIFVDFNRPRPYHPFKPWQWLVFTLFEPFAKDMWENTLVSFLPTGARVDVSGYKTFFGGFYQKLVLTKRA